MNSFFFGSGNNQLFGVYHAPKCQSIKSKSVLLCSPIGHEYMQSYRILRKLAEQLAVHGHHVLRFDWTGHGDSHGFPEDVSIETYVENIQIAADELLHNSTHTTLSLAGLRFGAVLAWLATYTLKSVDMLMLWEPVINGSEWIDSIHSIHTLQFKDNPSSNGAPLEILGYPFSLKMITDIRKNTLFSAAAPHCKELYLYTEHEHVTTLRDKLVTFDIPVKTDTSAGENSIWENSRTFDKVIMTSPALPSLCAAIDSGVHNE